MLIETIRVQVDPDEGDDLLEALSVRGLAARLEREAGEVEVTPPPEGWELWNLEVVSALEAWLEERELESVVARTERHEYVVRAPRELPRRGAPAADELDLGHHDADDTARFAALPAPPEPSIPYGLLAEPQLHRRRPRGLLIAGGAATAVVALGGILILVYALLQVL